MRFVFQISKKKIFQKTILNLKFEFQVQDSFLEYIFLEIWRFEKHIALSEKKTPLEYPARVRSTDENYTWYDEVHVNSVA